MDKLYKYQQVAIQKGGLLLSKSIHRGKLKWQCNEGHIFYLTAYKVHRRGKWCQTCGSSNGERQIRKILNSFNIQFIPQYKLSVCPRRKYDYYFIYNNRQYIIEYDGEQHFQFVRKYHKKKEKFIQAQIIDRIKTYHAWTSGITIIRIDYTQLNNIIHHIISGINFPSLVYFSNSDLYKYITHVNITHDQINLYS